MTPRTTMTLTVTAAVLIGFTAGFLVPKPPSNQGDCLLHYVKSGMTNDIAGFIIKTCKAKFPMESEKCRPAALAEAINRAKATTYTDVASSRQAIFLASVIMDDCK